MKFGNINEPILYSSVVVANSAVPHVIASGYFESADLLICLTVDSLLVKSLFSLPFLCYKTIDELFYLFILSTSMQFFLNASLYFYRNSNNIIIEILI